MSRTTLNIATPVLEELKRLQRKEKRPLGDLASELLADALARRKRPGKSKTPLNWIAREMKPLVDIADKEAVYAIMDKDRD